ncbi:cytosolic carboxypeptidase 1 isoform X1 [Fopius arisanus]|uniref:Agtpbp1 protein n=1 Tax=Fopius arisanus TaxID=64838 RepID=A0A0C9QI19_9HYME|nr:PREDICTED: cytosolic carboxypeptidase 1-like isoform X1 [Fopius arisanus]
MEYCTRVLLRSPHVFVDYHGHSTRKNVFLFGCSRSGSWSTSDRALSATDQPVQCLMLPRLMQKTSVAFALSLCSFKVERNKESTARVTIWRQLGVTRSYTMETSFCGCDQGSLAGSHLNTIHLKNVGKDFCAAMAGLRDNDETMTMDDSGKLERESQSCCPLNCIRERRNYSKCIQERRAECHMVRN